MTEENFELLTEKEAAHLIRMSPHFLRRDRASTNSDRIPFIRIGAAIRYRKADLLAWINGRLNMPHPKEVRASEQNPLIETKARSRSRKPDPMKADLPGAWLAYVK